METSMTKFKDLATVTVETAFRIFPVDDERYELVAVLEDWISTSDDMSTFRPTHQGPRFDAINEFFALTNDNLMSCSAAFLRVCETGYPRFLPLIVEDRARRFSATITENYDWLDCDTRDLCDATLVHCCYQLWRCVIGRLRAENPLVSGRRPSLQWELVPYDFKPIDKVLERLEHKRKLEAAEDPKTKSPDPDKAFVPSGEWYWLRGLV
jgi:hypothetical protein